MLYELRNSLILQLVSKAYKLQYNHVSLKQAYLIIKDSLLKSCKSRYSIPCSNLFSNLYNNTLKEAFNCTLYRNPKP